jgi:hypothetical protein
METDVIAIGLSCDTHVKKEYLGSEVFTAATIQIMVICIMTTQISVSSHQLF